MAAALLALAALQTGCVSYWRGKEMDAEMAAIQGQVDQLRDDHHRKSEALQQNIRALAEQITSLEQNLGQAISNLRTGSADTQLIVEDLRQKLAEANGRLAEFKEKLKGAEDGFGPLAAAPAGAPALPEDASELYRYGWEKKKGGECGEATRAFAAFAHRFPNHDRAPNAIFLLSDCQYSQKDYTGSIRSLQTILQKHVKSNKVDDALELMHDNFIALGRCKDALAFLETLVAEHASSDRIAHARRKLAKTKKTCK